MKKKTEHIKEFKDFKKEELSDGLFEMANYYEEITGLPMVIWAGSRSNAQHGPRVKVQRTYVQKMDSRDLFSVSVSDSPKIVAGDKGDITNADIEKVYAWIKLNKEALLKLWNMEFRDFDDFKKLIVKYKE